MDDIGHFGAMAPLPAAPVTRHGRLFAARRALENARAYVLDDIEAVRAARAERGRCVAYNLRTTAADAEIVLAMERLARHRADVRHYAGVVCQIEGK
jgi:hypothetical protein